MDLLFVYPQITCQYHFIIKSYCPVHIKYSSSIHLGIKLHIYQNAEVQTQAPRQSSNYFAISPGLASQLNCQKLSQKGIDVTWGAGKESDP